jgi:hypothetical protein
MVFGQMAAPVPDIMDMSDFISKFMKKELLLKCIVVVVVVTMMIMMLITITVTIIWLCIVQAVNSRHHTVAT